MSKSISSYPAAQKPEVIRRRLSGEARGLGYLAAVDAAKKVGIKVLLTKTGK